MRSPCSCRCVGGHRRRLEVARSDFALVSHEADGKRAFACTRCSPSLPTLRASAKATARGCASDEPYGLKGQKLRPHRGTAHQGAFVPLGGGSVHWMLRSALTYTTTRLRGTVFSPPAQSRTHAIASPHSHNHPSLPHHSPSRLGSAWPSSLRVPPPLRTAQLAWRPGWPQGRKSDLPASARFVPRKPGRPGRRRVRS